MKGEGDKIAPEGRPPPQQQRREHLRAMVMRAVRELTGTGAASLSEQTPLMEAGVDSLAATELAARLRRLSGAALSPTLVFEQPTPHAIAAHMHELMRREAVGSGSLRAARDATALVEMLGPVVFF